MATRLGHGHVDTTPALAPLLLDGDRHVALSGVSLPARLTVRVEGRPDTRLDGALLWTHFGASGPVVLNASRHWHRARLEGRTAARAAQSLPRRDTRVPGGVAQMQAHQRPRAFVATVLAQRFPAAVADAWARSSLVEGVTMAHLSREARRRLIQLLLALPLSVRDSRGYNVAEATAGGVPLDEIDPSRMESRRCAGLFLVGEMLDVDGRLGGFNFQWAWSSAWVAGRAIAGTLSSRLPPTRTRPK